MSDKFPPRIKVTIKRSPGAAMTGHWKNHIAVFQATTKEIGDLIEKNPEYISAIEVEALLREARADTWDNATLTLIGAQSIAHQTNPFAFAKKKFLAAAKAEREGQK